jgi:hypothetical protein
LLALADGAVPFTGAAIFRQVALHTNGLTCHKSLWGKLYLSMGGCGKAKVKREARVAQRLCGQNGSFPAGFFDRHESAC